MQIFRRSLIRSVVKHTVNGATGLAIISVASGGVAPLAIQTAQASLGVAVLDIASLERLGELSGEITGELPLDRLKNDATDLFSQTSQARRIRFRPNVPPPDRGTPRAPYGTGSRGDCLQTSELPPLAPFSGNVGMDITVSEHPSFWVYVPYAHSDVSGATFSLQSGDTEVYQQTVTLLNTPGVVEIVTPTTLPPLEVGDAYRWYFEMTCPQADSAEEPTPVTVTGLVQRVTPSAELVNELAIAQSPLEKVAAYANHQIWYETLSALAKLRQDNPEDQSLVEAWEDLLSDPDIGLENWAQMPILDTQR